MKSIATIALILAAGMAAADVIITDPPTGPTTATVDGVSLEVDPALVIRAESYTQPDGAENFAVYPQLGVNGHGPDWIAGVIPGSEWCGWGGCTLGRLGYHNLGGPLGTDLAFLTPYIGRPVVVTKARGGVEVRILTPPSLFGFLNEYFAGRRTLQDLFNFIAEYLR